MGPALIILSFLIPFLLAYAVSGVSDEEKI